MKKEFVPYEQALALKELGFDFEDDDTLGFYSIKYGVTIHQQLTKNDGYNPAILYQQAFRWFREKCGLYNIVDINSFPISFYYVITKITQGGIGVQAEKFNINTYEEAELECLKKLIEIVKQK
jgi:hypothetical protein